MSDQPLQLTLQTEEGQRQLYYHDPQRTVLSEILRREGVPLNTRCGQRGLCEGCRVDLLSGRVAHTATGQAQSPDGEALAIQACQYHAADAALDLRIPARSLLAYEPQVVSDFRINVPLAHNPLWQQHRLADNEDPLAVAQREVGDDRPLTVTSPAVQGEMAGQPRWLVVEQQAENWGVCAFDKQPTPRPLGLAVDIGTTTVAAVLVDLTDGTVLGRAADFNRQMHLGDDVLTRINLCLTDAHMIPTLQQAVVRETLGPLVRQLLDQAPRSDGRLVTATVAGNTTMLHLLAGVDPSPMGVAPFTPGFLEHRVLTFDAIGLPVPVSAGDESEAGSLSPHVHLLPGAAAYIGADLTAGIVASGLLYDPGPSLLVDVGTNGEIILKHGDTLLGCATAAGPAFEGARLCSGMRAGNGAISHLHVHTDQRIILEHEVIGQAKPVGLCGSAYIDLLGLGRQHGLLSAAGRFVPDRFDGLADRLMRDDARGNTLRIAYATGKQPLVVSETDIASLLQAKAAIAAGILTLLDQVDLTPADVKTLYLAGGFGMHVSVENAIAAGLLPGFAPEQVRVVGNTSLGGAYLTLLDAAALNEIERAARQLVAIELNLIEDFESRFIDQLSLP